MDTKESIYNYLDSIKNQYNQQKIEALKNKLDISPERIEYFKSVVETKRINQDFLLEEFFGHLQIEEILKHEHISLFDESYCWIIKRRIKTQKGEKFQELWRDYKDKYPKAKAMKLAQKISETYSRGYTETNITITSGKMIFCNYFLSKNGGSVFDVPGEEKYSDWYSLNNTFGIQNRMTYISETYNSGYCSLGNRTVDIYKVSENRLCLCPSDYYDEEKDIDIEPPETWEHVGSIDCGVWRVEFLDEESLKINENIDKEFFKKQHNVIVEINTGNWNIKNYYLNSSDEILNEKFGYPIWIDINRFD